MHGPCERNRESMDQEILRLKDLKMYFPAGKDRFVRAVDGVDLYINKGDVLGIVG